MLTVKSEFKMQYEDVAFALSRSLLMYRKFCLTFSLELLRIADSVATYRRGLTLTTQFVSKQLLVRKNYLSHDDDHLRALRIDLLRGILRHEPQTTVDHLFGERRYGIERKFEVWKLPSCRQRYFGGYCLCRRFG